MKKFILASFVASAAMLTNCTLANNGLNSPESISYVQPNQVVVQEAPIVKEKIVTKKIKKRVVKVKKKHLAKKRKSITKRVVHHKKVIKKSTKVKELIKLSSSKKVNKKYTKVKKATKQVNIKKSTVKIAKNSQKHSTKKFAGNNLIMKKVNAILEGRHLCKIKIKDIIKKKENKKHKSTSLIKKRILASEYRNIRKKITIDSFNSKFDFKHISLKFKEFKYISKPEPYSLSSKKRDPELLGPQSTIKNNPLEQS